MVKKLFVPLSQRSLVLLFDDAKLRTKKHPMKQMFIGWEFVGVFMGVLPILPHFLGVFSIFL